MNEEYEIIFITEEGRAIKNNKTGKIYHSEFEIIEEKNKEIDRLKNIINRIDNFVDRTIEVIKHQPSDNDEWILERLNGIKHLIELKENK